MTTMSTRDQQPTPAEQDVPAAEVRSLNVSFGRTRVLHDVDLVVGRNQVVGLVGESGSGKSTLGKTLVGINHPTSGQLLVEGQDLARLSRSRRREIRREVQYIPQDPYSSLSPRRTIGQTLAEALNPVRANPGRYRDEIAESLEQVRLSPDSVDKYPHEFSGGQRQRIAIARALLLHPKLIIADEITSALDVSVQAEVMALLRGMRGTVDSSMLFISHNLAVVQQLCDQVTVMSQGRIVESGRVDEVYRAPRDPYTRTLLDSVPGAPGFSLD